MRGCDASEVEPNAYIAFLGLYLRTLAKFATEMGPDK